MSGGRRAGDFPARLSCHPTCPVVLRGCIVASVDDGCSSYLLHRCGSSCVGCRGAGCIGRGATMLAWWCRHDATGTRWRRRSAGLDGELAAGLTAERLREWRDIGLGPSFFFHFSSVSKIITFRSLKKVSIF